MRKTAKAIAIIDQHSELIFLRKKIQQVVKSQDDEQKRLQAEFDAFTKKGEAEIDAIWAEVSKVLQDKGILPKGCVKTLRMTEGEQVIVQFDDAAPGVPYECPCPVCRIARGLGAKQP